MKKFTVLLSVLILGVLLSVSAYSENTSASDTFSVDLQEGNTFPVFTLETLNGKKIPSSRVFDKNKKPKTLENKDFRQCLWRAKRDLNPRHTV